MCGIVGFVADVEEPQSALKAMMDSIAHRGPDEEGSYFNGSAALGFRRLAIIDLANGHQPMANETGDIVVTFNGEIYNYRQIRAELIEHGHVFANDSDTECLVHAYEEYGYDMLSRLRGTYRWHILVKSPAGADIPSVLRAVFKERKPVEGVSAAVDVDPVDLF